MSPFYLIPQWRAFEHEVAIRKTKAYRIGGGVASPAGRWCGVCMPFLGEDQK
jgi:hypothetical protein